MMACYKQFLEQYNLTFTQYLTLIVLWENKTMRVKDLGNVLHLDLGTLTPLLKKLTFKGYIQRTQGHKDEREVFINVTEEGWRLKDHLCEIFQKKYQPILISLTKNLMFCFLFCIKSSIIWK